MIYGGYIGGKGDLRAHYFQVSRCADKADAATKIAALADLSGIMVPYMTREGLKYARPVPSDVHSIVRIAR